jgi:hypothetical protein
MYIGLHVNTRYSRQILLKLVAAGHILEKYANTEFHENPSSSGSRVVPCGREDEQKTDITEIIPVVAFRNFTNTPFKSLVRQRKFPQSSSPCPVTIHTELP